MSGQLWRNDGAPFHRADGTVVETGALVEATPQELRLWGYKLRVPATNLPPSKEERTSGVTLQPIAKAPPQATPTVPEQDARWPLSMSPERYLRLHPSGIHAVLARELAQDDGA